MQNGRNNVIKHLGIENMNLNKTLKKRTEKYIMNAYHYVTHFNLKFIQAVFNYTNTDGQ